MTSAGLKNICAMLCTVWLMLASGGAVHAENRVALVIGNSTYKEISALPNPVNDAKLMTRTLKELGFEVVMTLDANRVEMGRAIRNFGKSLRAAGRDAVGLFYYAGHGVQAHGGNYLIPIAASIEDDADLEIEGLSSSYIMRQMDNAGNRLNLIVLDACRNNPFKGRFRSSQRGLTRIEAASGKLIAFSAGPGQAALDGTGKNSPYTSALAKVMKQPGLKVEEVFKQVRVRVEEETGGAQTPWEESSLRGEFYFSPKAQPEIAEVTPQPALPAKQPTNTRPLLSEGRDTWSAIQNTRSKAILQTFIEEYPDSVYAKFALARLKELKSEEDTKRSIEAAAREQVERERAAREEAEKRETARREQTAREDARKRREKAKALREKREEEERERLRVAALNREAELSGKPDPDLPRKIQRALRQSGCNPGSVDGVWGRKSTAALKRFARWGGHRLPSEHLSRETLMLILKQSNEVCKDINKDTGLVLDPTRIDGRNYGAISYSQQTDSHGWASDYKSQDQAESRAVEECAKHGDGCMLSVWFANACGALAVGKGNGWGANWGRTREEAEQNALNSCNSNTSDCEVRRWVCTTR